jgi:EmrB/QacA subfamily drug resistance transporter
MSTDRRRWAALIVLCTGMLMIVLDLTVVNVALPSIQSDLGFSETGLAWVVNAYMVTFGGLLLLAGRLGDVIGRRRVFLAGLALFTAASLACGLAQSAAALVAARFVQGIGGAMTSAVILGMIVSMFPAPREQARAIGVFAFVASAGGAVGLLAGGVLTQTISWHWIFFINIPLAAVTALLTVRLVDADRGIGLAGGTDVLGALTVTAALVLGVYAIVGPAATHGWGDPATVLFGLASIALLGGFVVRERTCANPLVPMSIFRSRVVVGANLIQILGVAGMFGIFFLGSLYLEKVLGYDALQIGFAFLPDAVLMAVLSVRYTEPLASRFGARPVLIAGLVLVTAALVWFAQAPVHGTYLAHVFPAMALLGLGAGLAFPALMTLAMSGATAEDAGLASGVVNTTAQVGAALGLAVLATFSAARTSRLTASGADPASALTGGFHLAFWIAAGLVALAVPIAAFVLTPATTEPSPADANTHSTSRAELAHL